MDAVSMIARFGGDEELVRQLVALFVAECPRMLSDVRSSLVGGTADDVRRAAHAFKGSVANFTDGAPFQTAQALEAMGCEGRLTAAPAMVVRLEREVEDLLRAMTQI